MGTLVPTINRKGYGEHWVPTINRRGYGEHWFPTIIGGGLVCEATGFPIINY